MLTKYFTGTAAAGSGLGGLIYSLATNQMIKTIGLGWALRVLGIITCAVNVTCALLVRDRNKSIGSSALAFDHKLFLRPEFIFFLSWGVFSMLGYVVLNFSLPSYASSLGLSASQGTVLGAIFQLGQMLGRPPIGYFSDTFGRLNMGVVMTFLAGLFSLAIWIPAKTYGVLIFYSIIQGTVAGTFWAVVGAIGAELFGLKILPSVLSITWLVIVAPTLFSEPIGLGIVDDTPAGYLGTQIFVGMMYFAAAASLMYARAWKVGDKERQAAMTKREEDGLDGPGDNLVSPFIKRLLAMQKV
jgi:MFS family permease